MRFKIKVNENIKHEDACTSVKWGVNNEAYRYIFNLINSLSDDNVILKWDPNSLDVLITYINFSLLNFKN